MIESKSEQKAIVFIAVLILISVIAASGFYYFNKAQRVSSTTHEDSRLFAGKGLEEFELGPPNPYATEWKVSFYIQATDASGTGTDLVAIVVWDGDSWIMRRTSETGDLPQIYTPTLKLNPKKKYVVAVGTEPDGLAWKCLVMEDWIS